MTRVLHLPEHFTPTHQTAGLPGFPAVDVFGRSGMPVASPAKGIVVKLSGHPVTATTKPGGPFGWSIYIAEHVVSEGVFGSVYFLTHFGQRAANYWKLGAKIRAGQYLGKVAPYSEATNGATPSHIHEGYHAGAWAP